MQFSTPYFFWDIRYNYSSTAYIINHDKLYYIICSYNLLHAIWFKRVCNIRKSCETTKYYYLHYLQNWYHPLFFSLFSKNFTLLTQTTAYNRVHGKKLGDLDLQKIISVSTPQRYNLNTGWVQNDTFGVHKCTKGVTIKIMVIVEQQSDDTLLKSIDHVIKCLNPQ